MLSSISCSQQGGVHVLQAAFDWLLEKGASEGFGLLQGAVQCC